MVRWPFRRKALPRKNPADDRDGASSVELGFVLLSRAELPDPARVVARASRLDVGLSIGGPSGGGPSGGGAAVGRTPGAEDTASAAQRYALEDGGALLVLLMQVPTPGAAEMPWSPMAPDRDAIAGAVAHYVLVLQGARVAGEARVQLMARCLAAVVGAAPAIGGQLAGRAVYRRPAMFDAILENPDDPMLFVDLMVDVTVAREDHDTVTALSQGMEQFGRENILVRAPHDRAADAFDLTLMLARWLATDRDKQLPTGDTVGRTAEEQLRIERGPSPLDPEQTVIVLVLGAAPG